MLNASVGVQRVLARLRPVQSRRSTAAESTHGHGTALTASMRRVAAEIARVPAATAAAVRPRGTRRRDVGAIAVHVPTTSRRSSLAARSLTAGPAARPIGPPSPVTRGGHAHQPHLAARSAPAGKAPVAGQGRLVRRSLVASIGAERAVPAAAIAIVLLATALSSAPSFGASGAVGGPTGNGSDARLAVGGVTGAGGALGAPADQTSGTVGAATGVGGGVDGTIDQSGPDGGVAAAGGSTGTDPQANLDPSFVDDGTLLKPVAVDTTVTDGSALMRSYRVRSGDTLTGIAHKFGVSMMTIWWANNLTAKDRLHIGQTLTIPPVDGVVITVGSSDTLDSLAAKYGVDAATIVAANGLQDPNLVIGQTLTVPGALGDGISTPKPTHAPPARTGGSSGSSGSSGGSSGSTHPVAPPPRYSGGKLGWPVAGGYISQYFHYGHYAIDIAADPGTPVRAAAAGVVEFAGWKNNGGGYQVWISHGSGLYTTYNHMSAVDVGRGQHVGRGDLVGRVGMTGNATGPHLHFEVWRGPVWAGGIRVNPLLYL